MSSANTLSFVLNGKTRTYAGDPATRLTDVLRDSYGLTGTKVGCNAGDCGACTVLIDGAEACACLVAVGQCDGRRDRHCRGLGSGRRVDAAAARVPCPRRGAVRHLHARHVDGGDGLAGAQSVAFEVGCRGRAWRRAVPLHRLPEDRRGDPRCARVCGRGSVNAGSGARGRRVAGEGRRHRQVDRRRALRRRCRAAGCIARAGDPLAACACDVRHRRPGGVQGAPPRPRGAHRRRRAKQRAWHLSRHQGPAGAGRWAQSAIAARRCWRWWGRRDSLARVVDADLPIRYKLLPVVTGIRRRESGKRSAASCRAPRQHSGGWWRQAR